MDALIELVPFVAFAVTGGISYRLARRDRGKVLNWLWGVWAAMSAVFLVGMMTAPGWDALLFMLMLAGISAPVAAGGAIGGLIGVMRRENASEDQAT